MRAAAALLALAALAAPAATPAQERPSESDLFGAPAAPATPAPAATPPPADESAREAELLGSRDRARPAGELSKERNDPLALGGLAYLRANTGWSEGTPPSRWALSSPNLLDVFLDGRPNDRVRAFALGRLSYAPTTPSLQFTLLGSPASASTTTAALDQLWIGFDVARTLFLTVGKQHVKWGTGRFWNPTDYLHPVRRDPLAQFDDRSGVAMVKAHLPWEARGWNLYGVAVLEDVAGAQPTAREALGRPETLGTLGHVGWGARAEVVLGPAEVGLDALAQSGHRPRFGLDGSVGIWDLDLHGELALRAGRDAPRWRYLGGDRFSAASYRRDDPTGVMPAAVAGVDWSVNYSDQDSLTVSLEYAYDAAGYDSPRIYPILLASPLLRTDATGAINNDPACTTCASDPRSPFTPFYLGQHYAAASIFARAPGSWNDTTLVASLVANLSDGTWLARLDHSVVINTYLTVETYVTGHGGTRGGELRFGADVPEIVLFRDPAGVAPDVKTSPLSIAPPVLDLGVALRVKL